jgi:hypothetical protein
MNQYSPDKENVEKAETHLRHSKLALEKIKKEYEDTKKVLEEIEKLIEKQTKIVTRAESNYFLLYYGKDAANKAVEEYMTRLTVLEKKRPWAPIVYLKFTIRFPNECIVREFIVDQNTQSKEAEPSSYEKECLNALGIDLTSKITGGFGYEI